MSSLSFKMTSRFRPSDLNLLTRNGFNNPQYNAIRTSELHRYISDESELALTVGRRLLPEDTSSFLLNLASDTTPHEIQIDPTLAEKILQEIYLEEHPPTTTEGPTTQPVLRGHRISVKSDCTDCTETKRSPVCYDNIIYTNICIFEQLKCLGKIDESAVAYPGTTCEDENLDIEDEIAVPELSQFVGINSQNTAADNRSHLTAVITPYTNGNPASIPVPVQHLQLPLEVTMPNHQMDLSSGANVYGSPFSHGFQLN